MRILVADDNPTNQKMVELCLRAEGMEVQSFEQGREARDYLRDNAVDVLLCDASLPEVDGYELCLLAKSRDAQTPVILMISRFGRFDEERARQSGCDLKLAKPFSATELIEAIQGLVAARSSASNGKPPLLFRLPLPRGPQPVVFSLGRGQCRFRSGRLERRLPVQPPPRRTDDHGEASAEVPEAPALSSPSQPESEADRSAAATGEDRAARPPSSDRMERVMERVVSKLPDLIRSVLDEERN